jgi:hypothetical protein
MQERTIEQKSRQAQLSESRMGGGEMMGRTRDGSAQAVRGCCAIILGPKRLSTGTRRRVPMDGARPWHPSHPTQPNPPTHQSRKPRRGPPPVVLVSWVSSHCGHYDNHYDRCDHAMALPPLGLELRRAVPTRLPPTKPDALTVIFPHPAICPQPLQGMLRWAGNGYLAACGTRPTPPTAVEHPGARPSLGCSRDLSCCSPVSSLRPPPRVALLCSPSAPPSPSQG